MFFFFVKFLYLQFLTTIGAGAFRDNNNLNDIVIFNSVTSIGETAFQIDRANISGFGISIGANVVMADNSFRRTWRSSDGRMQSDDSFAKYYIQNGRKAGTYIYDSPLANKWNHPDISDRGIRASTMRTAGLALGGVGTAALALLIIDIFIPFLPEWLRPPIE